jgi:hypothetical protein
VPVKRGKYNRLLGIWAALLRVCGHLLVSETGAAGVADAPTTTPSSSQSAGGAAPGGGGGTGGRATETVIEDDSALGTGDGPNLTEKPADRRAPATTERPGKEAGERSGTEDTPHRGVATPESEVGKESDPDRALDSYLFGDPDKEREALQEKTDAEQKPENVSAGPMAVRVQEKLAKVQPETLDEAMRLLGLDAEETAHLTNAIKLTGNLGREVGEARKQVAAAAKISETLKPVVTIDDKTGDVTAFDGLKLLAVATKSLGRDGVMKALHAEGLTVIPLKELEEIRAGAGNGNGTGAGGHSTEERLLRQIVLQNADKLAPLLGEGVVLDAKTVGATSYEDLRDLVGQRRVVEDQYQEAVANARRQESQKADAARNQIKTRLDAFAATCPIWKDLGPKVAHRAAMLFAPDGSVNRVELADLLCKAEEYDHIRGAGVLRSRVEKLAEQKFIARCKQFGIPLTPGEEPSKEAIRRQPLRPSVPEEEGPTNRDEGAGPDMTGTKKTAAGHA